MLFRSSVREVHEAFPADRKIDFATVQTYLRRLEAKGYVSGCMSGRARIYSPKVQPRRVIRQTIDELVERLFGGETLPLMRHLIEDHGVSAEELTELRQLIERVESEKGRGDGRN